MTTLPGSRHHDGTGGSRLPPNRGSVLEQQLAVFRQRPEVVRDERLELVDDLAQRALGWDDIGREGLGLGMDRARLVCAVLRILECVDGLDERVGKRRDPDADGVDALRRWCPGKLAEV